MKKQYLVKARQEIVYEKIIEAESESEAFKLFYETRNDDDIIEDNGLEVENAEEVEI